MHPPLRVLGIKKNLFSGKSLLTSVISVCPVWAAGVLQTAQRGNLDFRSQESRACFLTMVWIVTCTMVMLTKHVLSESIN